MAVTNSCGQPSPAAIASRSMLSTLPRGLDDDAWSSSIVHTATTWPGAMPSPARFATSIHFGSVGMPW